MSTDYPVRDLNYYATTPLAGTIRRLGCMRGAHGQTHALRWVELESGDVLFHDAGRAIYGVCTVSRDDYTPARTDPGRSPASLVDRCYIQGYAAHTWHGSASYV